jgi:hypothetical protein
MKSTILQCSVNAIAGILLLTCDTGTPNRAWAVVVQLGDQDFTNATGLTLAQIDSASVGEPAPFDRFRGTDLTGGPPFSESWTFNYPIGAYASAVLTLGICDHDSQAPGNQVAFFGLDGNNLTNLLNAQFESAGGRHAEYNVYSVTIPPSSLTSLGDGIANFTLTLQGPSLGGDAPLDPTPDSLPQNGAGLDFARLTLVVPEPATLTPLVLAIAGVAAAARRRGAWLRN